jgi:hypothetical protein
MNHIYFAYGLAIRSVLSLPELIAVEGMPDVIVRIGMLTPESSKPIGQGPDFLVTDEGVYLFCENEGIFLVRDGKEIIIDPVPNVDERMLRQTILGPALAVVLYQRGRFPLHAATVKIREGAVAIMGGSGYGKSALAATFYKRGHEIVADDVTAIQTDGGSGPLVFPGFPQMKLWPEVISFLGDDPERLPCIEPGVDKRVFRTNTEFSEKSIPLHRIYALAEAHTKKIIPLKPQDALVELVRHSYRASLLQWIGLEHHFSQCTSLVNSVPIKRLNRPLALSSLPEVARMVEEDLAHV